MFDLALQVRLRQAKAALREGRLDEAFAIATERSVRDHREGQRLLEELVGPLSERAARNFAQGRLSEALLDVERAIEAGGNRPEVLKLRAEIQAACAAREGERRREAELVESARRRVLAGSLAAGEELLGQAGSELPEARRLLREIEDRERRADRASARASELLEAQDAPGALAAVRELAAASPKDSRLPGLLSAARALASEAAWKALAEGKLSVATCLYQELKATCGGIHAKELEEAIALAWEARSALSRGEFETLRERLEALFRRAPGALWIREALEAAEEAQRAIRALRAGPLGAPQALSGTIPKDRTVRSEKEPQQTPANSKFLLWVDGVGTYLVTASDRISLGRPGSSYEPDIALSAGSGAKGAEIVRADDDYFLVSTEEPVLVGGKPVRRKLLSPGDTIELGPRCRLVFRLPTPLSATAVLSLHKGQRLPGDVRHVILMKDHLVLGPAGKSHVEIGTGAERIVLSWEPRGLVCRAGEEIFLGGKAAGREAIVPRGIRAQVGEVTFTVTDTRGGRA